MKAQISIADFSKLDLRVGEVVDVVEVEQSNKLLELKVDFGPEIGVKTIFSGIKKWYSPDTLRNRKFIFLLNLEPKVFKIGEEELASQGMILAADSEEEAVLYNFDKDVTNGSKIG